MFRNIFYESYKNTVHLWYTDSTGKNRYKKEIWTPYLFKKNPKGVIDSIYGDKTSKLTFKSYKEYSDFQKNHKKNIFENNCKADIQYLTDKYHSINDDDIIPPELKIYSIDIEVHTEVNPGVFPSPQKAEEPITIITIYDWKENHYYSFGLHKYDNKNKNVTYIYCNDCEQTLLKKFYSFVYKNPPDVYTGWNISMNKKMSISGFDFPYIINRTINLFNENTELYKLLSPIKKVRCWKSGKDLTVSIAGVSILDYQAIYKWYSPKNLEKYTLEFVCKEELKMNKLDYEGSLSELYINDWQRYVDYNIRDVELIKELEDKLGYISLIQSLCLLSRSPLEYYMAMTSLLEGKLITYYRRNNLCAPFFNGGVQESYPAAYVKSPDVGIHDWITSIDIASSYPTAIITLNMSIETYLGRIQILTHDEIIKYTNKKKFPKITIKKFGVYKNIEGQSLISFNNLLKNKLISIAPCGTIFKTNKKGVIADMEKDMFLKRKLIKKQMKLLYGIKGQENEIKKLFSFQWALKILLNSMYGIMAVPYSRYFCLDIAEAITSCARHTILMGESFVNKLLNDPDIELKKIIQELKNVK